MKYKSYLRNYVVFPGSEKPLHRFLNTTIVLNGGEEKHKLKHAFSSNSEDALTWSCFDVLRQQPREKLVKALDEIMEDAFAGRINWKFENEQNVEIHIGKNYSAGSTSENTELDATIETNSKLIFIEAKLYSKISLPDDVTPHDQILRKLRIGVEVAARQNKSFYFIFLDIAPIEHLLTYGEKSVSAKYFEKYKVDHNSLAGQLIENSYTNLIEVSTNMGWLTWASLFKTVLRAVVTAT